MKKKRLMIIGISIIVVLLLGVTYAWFTYYQEGQNQKLVMADIYLNLTDGNDTVSLEKIFPESIEEARARNDNLVNFSVTGRNTTGKDLYYEIKLIYGDENSDPNKIRFNDKHLKFDLVEINNNEETYLLDAVSFDAINNKRIWVETINANQTQEITKTYQLRVWLSDTVLISDSDPNADYTATSVNGSVPFKDHYASIKVAVYGDFIEKSLNNVYQKVKMDYNDEKASLFTLTHQDSLDGYGHQDVYYYTSDTNSNVLFNDTCWQIVRTTDTGGVKLLYNGLPEEKQVYQTYKTLADTDITVSTNSASYPYTFSDGKWTSSGAVPNSGTGTLQFTVNEAGYYIINYDVSTEAGNDVMYIYKDNVLLRQDSGVITDGIRLGNLTTSNVIKIEYKKNDSATEGRDNIIIEIQEGQGNYETKTSCDTKRLPGMGLIGDQTSKNIGDGTYKYGTTYTYTSSGFTLGGTISDVQWSDTTYENLLGKYTCASTSTTCTTLYYVQTYNSNVQAGVTRYTIGVTRKYNEIGNIPFNEHYKSASSVGYMYNNMYEYNTRTPSSGVSYRFGHDVAYSNGVYTLTGTTQDVTDWATAFTANNDIIQNTHYTCFNEAGSNTCGDTVYFVYYTDASVIRYIELKGGKTKDDALYEMLNYKGSDTSKADANINVYDSAIKQMIDHWYENVGLTSKTQKLEDTIYCNDRSIRNNDLRNWDLNKTTKETWTLYFKMVDTNVNTNTLTCSNVTDQFSTKNSKAKLTYPVGLLTEQERALMTSNYARTGLIWWLASPSGVLYNRANERTVDSSGSTNNHTVYFAYGVRPSLTLDSDVEFTSGSGTYDDAYVVG